MTPELIALAAQQHGLLTRAQLLSADFDPVTLRRFVRQGRLVVVRRGIYLDGAVWAALDEYVGRPRLRALAASLTLRRDHVLSHDSAALWHGLPILRATPELVHVTRPGVQSSRLEHGIKHHSAHYEAEQLREVEGIALLDLPRTAVDIAREHGLSHGLVACDAALRLGVSRAQLRDALAVMTFWPGVRNARQSVSVADPRAESAGESLSRLLVMELGIGMPELQFVVDDGYHRYVADLRVGRHLFEFDGRIKYLRPESGGVAESPEDAVWAEKRRGDFLLSMGYGLSRIVWEDFWGAARERAKARLWRESEATLRRYGAA